MRLFIAIPLPKEIRWQISAVLEEWKEKYDLRGFRWVPEEQWHITVVFLGDQPESAVSLISGAMARVAQQFTGPSLQFERIEYGPSPYEPRMIWLSGSEETSRGLGGIRDVLYDELKKEDMRWEEDWRPFRTHVTMARFDIFRIKGTLSPLDISIDALGHGNFLLLFQSALTPQGPIYTLIKEAMFKS